MKIGTLVYRSSTGLAYQSRAYVEHLGIEKVMVIDLSALNGTKQNYDWYVGEQAVNGYPRPEDIDKFLDGLDVVLIAETPLNYHLYERARELGVKTAVVPNWEFFDYFRYPNFPLPDLFISPSVWHLDELKQFAVSHGKRCVYLHHPVDRKAFKFRLRKTAKFLHVAGKPAVHDRNGTWEFLQAVPDGTVVTQSEELARHIRMRYRNSKVYSNVVEPGFIYQLGDVLVFPRRYGGNCLPLNEALSSGMPVIMPDISPNNHLLPKEWLVPAKVVDYFEPRTKIDLYSIDQEALAEKLNWFRSCDIEAESKKADEIAESISWDTLKGEYIKVLEQLCQQASITVT